MEIHSAVADFYANKTILITGASGFIGKVLIWKLLHSCPNIDKIYVLIRPKYGKSVKLRMGELLQVPIFDTFRTEKPHLLKKIIPIEGDVGLENLGLTPQNEELLISQVHVVFHVAAILKLDANLKDAVSMNVEGTLRLLNLCTRFTGLLAFIHTSTAYCHCDLQVLQEKAYPLSEDPYDVIRAVHWLPSHILESITNKIIKPHPNTYTYTKRLAEKVVADFYPRLPVSITRPSIVTPAWEEPIPGWVDNKNGPTGLLIGAGKGVIRTMYCNGDLDADLIPVDIVCNGLIVASWNVATNLNKSAEIPVYNLVQAGMEPITWGGVLKLGEQVLFDHPFQLVLWYPGGNLHSNKYQHLTWAFLFHWIPAILIDFIMLLLGRKRFMINVHKKIYHGQKLLQYFTTRNWTFLNDSLLKLGDSLPQVDKNTFKLTPKGVDRNSYMLNCLLMARHYILKEDPKSIPAAKIRMKVLHVVHIMFTIMFYLLIGWTFLKICDSAFGIRLN